jgi:hypothetical protein
MSNSNHQRIIVPSIYRLVPGLKTAGNHTPQPCPPVQS